MATTYVLPANGDLHVRSAPDSGDASAVSLAVGKAAAGVYRALVDTPLPDWDALQVTSVTSAKLRMKIAPNDVLTRGATPRVIAYPITGDWNEATKWSTQPGVDVAYEVIVPGNLPGAAGTIVELELLPLLKRSLPTRLGGAGKAWWGVRLKSLDEDDAAYSIEFVSRQGTYAPQLVITAEVNRAPFAPSRLSPPPTTSGDPPVLSLSRIDTKVTGRFRAARADPDAGDYMTALRIQIYPESASDTVPGTRLIGHERSSIPGGLAIYEEDVDLSTLTPGTVYRWRSQTADRFGVWGPWTPLADARFRPNTVPGAPSNLAEDRGDTTPTLFGSLVDADPGAALSAVEIEVVQDTPTGTLVRWASGWQATSGTRFAIAYAGQELSFDQTYRWRARVQDQFGSIGAWSGWRSFTLVDATGPSNMTPRTVETKQASLTPTLTIGHSAAFDQYELEVAADENGVDILWDKGVTGMTSTTSHPVPYGNGGGSKPLTRGDVFWWRAKVRVGGTTWTEWSPWYPFYIDAAPLGPVGSVDGASVIDTPAGKVHVVPSLTPVLRFPYVDPDVEKGYADPATARRIEITRVSDGAAVASSPITTGTAATHTVGAGLAWDTDYLFRARFTDSSGVQGPFGEQVRFRPSQPPELTAGAPAADATVTDPTPELAWGYSSPSNKEQAAYRVRIYGDGT